MFQSGTHTTDRNFIWHSLILVYITDYTDNFDEALAWGIPTEINRNSRYLLSRALTAVCKRAEIKGEKIMQTEWKVKGKQQFKNNAMNNGNTPSKTGYLNF